MEFRRHCLLWSWGLWGCRSLGTNLCWRFQSPYSGRRPSTLLTTQEIPKMEILICSTGPSDHLSTFLPDFLLCFYTSLDHCAKYYLPNFQFHLASLTWRHLWSSRQGWCLSGWYSSTWATTALAITRSASASSTFICTSVSAINLPYTMFPLSTSFSPICLRTLTSPTYSVIDKHIKWLINSETSL